MTKLLKELLTQSQGKPVKPNSESLIKDTTNLVIRNKLDSLFYFKTKEHEERKGLHASAIIETDAKFCYREQVLSLFYKRNETEKHDARLMRVFKAGDMVHYKWQNMFRSAGIAKSIEQRGHSKYFDLYMTPDAIVEINGQLWVVEIKSCNFSSYMSFKNTHPSGGKQLQMYMHFYCIPRGFVLCDNKNTQDHKEFLVNYEPETVRPYLERLYNIDSMADKYENTGKLPSRKCDSQFCTKAKQCGMSQACFGAKLKLAN